VNDGEAGPAPGTVGFRFRMVRLVQSMGRVNDVLLAAQDLVFGVKRLNRAFCSAVTETSNDHGRQKRHPEEGEDY